MVDIVKNNLDKIIDTCQEMGVKSLYLFGSAARGNDFGEGSDVDFGYEMQRDNDGMFTTKYDFFDLLWKLEEIVGRKVDLVYTKGIRNKYMLNSIKEDEVKLYEA